MPERQDQGNQGNEPWNSSSDQHQHSPSLDGTGRHRAIPLDGTGKLPALSLDITGQHRAIPKRPAGMPHLDTPPTTQRIARPKLKPVSRKRGRRRLLIVASILLVGAILAFFGMYGLLNLANGFRISAGAATTSTDFLDALSHQNYDQAYKDLGPAITLHINPEQFKHQAEVADRCYGGVENYSEVANSATSATSPNGGTSQSYTYTITRANFPKPYQLRLTVQQDQYGTTWKIADYGNSLAPQQQNAVCK